MNPPAILGKSIPPEVLLEKYYPDFSSLSKIIARRYPTLEANDLLQETALGLLRANWHANSDVSDKKTRELIIRRLLRNTAIKLVARQRALKRQTSATGVRVEEHEVSSPAQSSSHNIDFAEKMRRLTPENRRVITAFLLHESKTATGRALHARPQTLSPDAARMFGTRKLSGAVENFFKRSIKPVPPPRPKSARAARRKVV